MFWGLIMEPKRRYTQIVKRPFHVSMAALDIFSSTDDPCQVMLNYDDRNYLLCTLQKDKQVQCVLDLNFEVGDKVIFATNGDSNVHLTGYLADDDEDLFEEQEEEEEEVDDAAVSGIKKRKPRKAENQPPKKKSKTEQLLDEVDNYDSDDDDSFTLSKLAEDDDSDESLSSDEDGDLAVEEEEDDEDDDNDEENEESSDDDDDEEASSLSDEEEVEKPKLNGVASKKKQKEAQKKSKLVPEIKSPNKLQKGEKSPSKQEKTPKADNLQKGNKTPKVEKTPKGNKTPKGDGNQKNGSAVKSPKEQAGSPQKRTLEGGVIIQDLAVGQGQIAKPGKLAEVYYEGRLKQNNKVFDKLRQGTGFKFRLGKQEVIKGWDVGVAGMKIGGKRRIICPPNMAYGVKGSAPQIPPNSTLVFDVELKNIK